MGKTTGNRAATVRRDLTGGQITLLNRGIGLLVKNENRRLATLRLEAREGNQQPEEEARCSARIAALLSLSEYLLKGDRPRL
jgi:hypothetical protein